MEVNRCQGVSFGSLVNVNATSNAGNLVKQMSGFISYLKGVGGSQVKHDVFIQNGLTKVATKIIDGVQEIPVGSFSLKGDNGNYNRLVALTNTEIKPFVKKMEKASV